MYFSESVNRGDDAVEAPSPSVTEGPTAQDAPRLIASYFTFVWAFFRSAQ